MFTDIIELTKLYGVGVAGWAVAFAVIAWMAGKGGTVALKHVRTIMDAGEELRSRYRKSLEECDVQIAERDAHIRELRSEIETAHRTLRQMHADMLRMQQQHKNEMLEAQEQLHQLNIELREARSMRRRTDPTEGPASGQT